MQTMTRPEIIVAREDHDRLIDLALQALDRAPGAVLLLSEMERAKLADVPPPNVVAINDSVTFEYDGSHYRDVRLVYPRSADILKGNISVLAPVGAALIGVAEGDTFCWVSDDRRIHRLSVEKVERAS